MTEEERREMMRKNYAAQMDMLGYKADGNPKDMVEVVRCKDCKKRYTVVCIQEEAGNINNDDDWFCADGERKK